MSASLEKGLARFKAVLDAPAATFFSSCVNCGVCADACLFYTETGDPRYTPIHKLEPLKKIWRQTYTLQGRLAALIGLAHPPTNDELATWSHLVYDSCTLCGRCSLACPMGIDITGLIRQSREGMALAGHAPKGLRMATQRAVNKISPMGLSLETLQAQIRHQEADTGLAIPMDVAGAECLVLLSSMEIVSFPEAIGALAKIFHHACMSWTLSSEAFEATNSGIQIGVSDLAAQLVERVVNAAEKLGVKRIITPECGHAYTALRWEGPNLIGRPIPFEVLHILELMEQLRRDGRLQLRVRGKEERPLSFHDPCQLVRRGGVEQQPRTLLQSVATHFKEMAEHGKYNWCCGGGGGVSAIDEAEPLRRTVFRRKKRQIDALGVHTLVTACANCRAILEEDVEAYEMDVEVVGLIEMVADHLKTVTCPPPRTAGSAP
jgi:Fe-S oxidoreductase